MIGQDSVLAVCDWSRRCPGGHLTSHQMDKLLYIPSALAWRLTLGRRDQVRSRCVLAPGELNTSPADRAITLTPNISPNSRIKAI